MEKIIGIRELRENTNHYANAVSNGTTFIVVKRTKPLFKISPVDNENWEEVIDFTKIQKGGVEISDLLKRI